MRYNDCLASAANLSLAANYASAHSQILCEMTGASLINRDANLTVGLRIHKGTDVSKLEDAVNSLASQTYRRFKTILLVDGPWAFAEPIAKRFGLPLICTGMEPDIEHCSWLHRQAVEQCGTEFYKPLDYDDQILPTYLERAVATLEREKVDVYGCKLMTLENGDIQPRLHWPNKPLETMFTGNSDDNMLPHSSVTMRTKVALKAGNYQERAIGLGADDYHLWYRIHQVGGKFYRDDEVRNVVYRIHEQNSLKIRRERFGNTVKEQKAAARRNLFQKAAAAAGFTVIAGGAAGCADDAAKNNAAEPGDKSKATATQVDQPAASKVDPPHS